MPIFKLVLQCIKKELDGIDLLRKYTNLHCVNLIDFGHVLTCVQSVVTSLEFEKFIHRRYSIFPFYQTLESTRCAGSF